MIDLEALAKILPVEKVYDDLLARGFKQAGGLFEDFVKTVRLALPRIQLDAVDQDRFRTLIEAPYFRVPPERRTLPPARLVGEILQGARFEPKGTPIFEMFEELMQRGYDSDKNGEAHPAFPGFIGQLSPDECKLLSSLAKGIVEVPYQYTKGEHYTAAGPLEHASIFTDLTFPAFINIYAQHLEAMGFLMPLIGVGTGVVEQGAYAGFQRYVFNLRLNGFGRLFYRAVTRHNDSGDKPS
ncbi:Abi-alpha family protein [Lichenibacterium ramalinae]|uniref:Abi-alpha family protein n=1 Tax=Lichenibacterium ramalinae TaxID=2316527 RepID=UPI0013EA10D4|nr:Abi-alpha family protein [Lichenibacterium ramalinae]